MAKFTGFANSAENAGFDRYFVVGFEGCDRGADFVDGSRGFMTHYQGVGGGDFGQYSTTLPEVDLGGWWLEDIG